MRRNRSIRVLLFGVEALRHDSSLRPVRAVRCAALACGVHASCVFMCVTHTHTHKHTFKHPCIHTQARACPYGHSDAPPDPTFVASRIRPGPGMLSSVRTGESAQWRREEGPQRLSAHKHHHHHQQQRAQKCSTIRFNTLPISPHLPGSPLYIRMNAVNILTTNLQQ